MPSINIDFLKLLHDDYSKYNTFIESGTFVGETIFNMEPHFKHLHTIEISKYLYDKVKHNVKKECKINFILGDSSVVFESLLPEIKDNCIFFLDGHYSAGNTGKGNKDCPLVEEILHINKLFKGNAILIIDDFRLFGKRDGECNWSNIDKEVLLFILRNRIKEVYHLDSICSKDDRLIIHINPILTI